MQKVINSLLIFNASATDNPNLLPKTAPINSKRVMLVDCKGATYVDVTNDNHTFSFLDSDLM